MTEWRPLPGHPPYEVSDDGQVRSPRGVLRPGVHRKTGYHYVTLAYGPRRTARVHVLVLEAFVGPRPLGLDACHEDNRDRTDNRLENLRWDTRSANINDSVRDGSHHYARRTHCGKGHEFTPENTGTRRDSGRYCRACMRRSA